MADLRKQTRLIQLLEHCIRNGIVSISGQFKEIEERINEMYQELELCLDELEELDKVKTEELKECLEELKENGPIQS